MLFRQSFEKNLNFASKDYKSYMDPATSADATSYKQTGGGGRHLEIYDAVHLDDDDDATQTAQNPFSDTDTYPPPPHRHRTGQAGAGAVGGVAASGGGGRPYSIDGVTQSSSSVSRQMLEVNEIDYETAVAPMDDLYDSTTKDMYLTDSDSMNSAGGMGAGAGGPPGYKGGGSTQQLVAPRSTSHRGKPPSAAAANLAFVDSPRTSIYSSNNSQVSGNQIHCEKAFRQTKQNNLHTT